MDFLILPYFRASRNLGATPSTHMHKIYLTQKFQFFFYNIGNWRRSVRIGPSHNFESFLQYWYVGIYRSRSISNRRMWKNQFGSNFKWYKLKRVYRIAIYLDPQNRQNCAKKCKIRTVYFLYTYQNIHFLHIQTSKKVWTPKQ